jgi:hypothetical protein
MKFFEDERKVLLTDGDFAENNRGRANVNVCTLWSR